MPNLRAHARLVMFIMLTAATTCGCSTRPGQESSMNYPSRSPMPPAAEVHPQPVISDNGVRIDPYYWLRDDLRLDPKVLGYLRAENEYADALMAPLKPLQERLYQEIVSRIPKDDVTVPYRDRGYWYYTRFQSDREYPVYARRRDTADAPEAILLDVNELARSQQFFEIGNWRVSPDNRLLAYAEDTNGRHVYVLRIKNLETAEPCADVIENADPGIAWAGDSRAFLYVQKDPETLLGRRVRKHVLGTNPADDPLVWEQTDTSFYTDVVTSKSGRFLFIASESTVSSEWWFAEAKDPELRFQVVLPRERDHEYSVEHVDERFVILTNREAPNFRVVEVPIAAAGSRSQWREVLPHRLDAFLHGFEVFRDFLAVAERSDGLRKIRIKPWHGGADRLIAADEAAYTALIGANAEIDTNVLRYTYSSLTTPATTFDYDMHTGSRTLLKRDPVPPPFDPANYVSEYVHAPARDGTRIPVSMVYRKGFQRDGSAPLYQYGYGSYGISVDPVFVASRLSLLDRGFVVAIAHIRGGQELGRQWYDGGRLLNKKNTFTDFIDVTDFLVKERYAAADKVVAHGRSAGGLLMGAIANMAPQKYRVILANVPFVDAVTTMLDDSIPLTTNEYEEWGDPRELEFYEYMLSYSPYDQVSAQAYPAMVVTTGLWDGEVQYFEPAKWVARLRATKTNDEPLLFRTHMEAGHAGQSGRFRRHQETALEFAFALGEIGAAAATAAVRKER
ncbi:MAG TPA: S9 family peptidase [Steroidobacteraceae bacterium]